MQNMSLNNMKNPLKKCQGVLKYQGLGGACAAPANSVVVRGADVGPQVGYDMI